MVPTCATITKEETDKLDIIYYSWLCYYERIVKRM